MNVNLTPELEKLIQRKVQSGHYNNQSEVVREALRLMIERDRAQERHIERLKSALEVGLAQAERGEVIEGRKAVAQVRATLRRNRKSGKKAG